MKHAYLVMAHAQPEMLKLLLRKLDDTDNEIYLHLDKKWKVDVEQFAGELSLSKLHLIKRIKVFWGHYSQIDCELRLIEEAVKTHHDYYHLVSGADLPLKTNAEINSFFENNPYEFVDFDKKEIAEQSYVSRYSLWWFARKKTDKPFLKVVYFIRKAFLGVLRRLLNLLFDRTRPIKYIRFMKGSSFFDITHEFAEYVLSKEEWIKKTFKFSKCADEIFMHTIIWNSPFRIKNTEKGTHFVDWSNPACLPAVLNMEHYKALCETELLFARKFDCEKSKELIQKLYGITL